MLTTVSSVLVTYMCAALSLMAAICARTFASASSKCHGESGATRGAGGGHGRMKLASERRTLRRRKSATGSTCGPSEKKALAVSAAGGAAPARR